MIVVATRRILGLRGPPGPRDRLRAPPDPHAGTRGSRTGICSLGPFQFMTGLRKRHPSLHRWTGRVVLASALVIGITALIMARKWRLAAPRNRRHVCFRRAVPVKPRQSLRRHSRPPCHRTPKMDDSRLRHRPRSRRGPAHRRRFFATSRSLISPLTIFRDRLRARLCPEPRHRRGMDPRQVGVTTELARNVEGRSPRAGQEACATYFANELPGFQCGRSSVFASVSTSLLKKSLNLAAASGTHG